MKYSKEQINSILNESERDLNLKQFLNKTKKVFGEDYASLIFTCDYDIVKSMNKFSSKFNNLDSIHLQSMLLQSALLSNNKYKDLIFQMIKDDNYYSLFPFIKENIYFRKGLVRTLVNNCDKPNIALFNRLEEEEKEKVLDGISLIKDYEMFLRKQEQIDSYVYKYKTKRGKH